MDKERIAELREKIITSMTEEQKERARACKSIWELMDFLAAEGIELPAEAMKTASGSGNPGSLI